MHMSFGLGSPWVHTMQVQYAENGSFAFTLRACLSTGFLFFHAVLGCTVTLEVSWADMSRDELV